jgi:hypothetical protein
MSTKISKGDVVLAKDLTEDYWGSEIEFEKWPGVKSIMVLKRHRASYENTMIDLYPEGGENRAFTFVGVYTEVTILTPPWGHHPEQPTEMGTIIQIEGDPDSTCVVDYYGDILSLESANHLTWDTVKRNADILGAKILVHKPTASYDDGLTDIDTCDDWDPSKEELYRTRQWEDWQGDIWSFRDKAWGYSRLGCGRWVYAGAPRYHVPLRLVPKDEEIS